MLCVPEKNSGPQNFSSRWSKEPFWGHLQKLFLVFLLFADLDFGALTVVQRWIFLKCLLPSPPWLSVEREHLLVVFRQRIVLTKQFRKDIARQHFVHLPKPGQTVLVLIAVVPRGSRVLSVCCCVEANKPFAYVGVLKEQRTHQHMLYRVLYRKRYLLFGYCGFFLNKR